MGELARATLGPGSVGFIITQLMFLAIASYLGGWVARIAKKKEIAEMMNTACVLIGVVLIADMAVEVLTKVIKVFGY